MKKPLFALLLALVAVLGVSPASSGPSSQGWVNWAQRGWIPRDLGNSAISLNSEQGVTTVGSAVTTWTDQSGNGVKLTDGGVSGNRPTLTANVTNGRPALLFNHTANQLLATSSSSLSYERTQAFTLFVVAQSNQSTVSPSGDILFGKGNPLAAGWGLEVVANGTIRFGEASSGANRLLMDRAVTTKDVTHLYEVTYDGSSTPGGVAFWVDGTSLALSTTVNSLSATIVNSSFAGCGQNSGFTTLFGGYIFRIDLFTRVLSSTDRIVYETHVKPTYGL